MGSKFVPLTLELVDEGELVRDINAELADVQKRLIAFVKSHGDKALKSSAKLKIEIAIVCTNPNPRDQAFAIKSQLSTMFPKRPASVSLAMAGDTQDDEPCLFVRQSGSDNTPPAQGKLATRDGREITDKGTAE